MSNQDKIRLAETMGWTKVKPYREGIYGLPPDTRAGDDALWLEFCLNIPDPENDANDDYAVLAWMREKTPSIGTHIKWASDDEGWVFFNELHLHKVDYTIGDYARAALKALERV